MSEGFSRLLWRNVQNHSTVNEPIQRFHIESVTIFIQRIASKSRNDLKNRFETR
jgi:hypothetical protein